MSKLSKRGRRFSKGNALIWLIVAVAMFMLGTLLTDYQYRDIPKTAVVGVRSNKELESENKFLQCKQLATTLVVREAETANLSHEILESYDKKFNRGQSIDPDKVEEINKNIQRKQELIERIEAL